MERHITDLIKKVSSLLYKLFPVFNLDGVSIIENSHCFLIFTLHCFYLAWDYICVSLRILMLANTPQQLACDSVSNFLQLTI